MSKNNKKQKFGIVATAPQVEVFADLDETAMVEEDVLQEETIIETSQEENVTPVLEAVCEEPITSGTIFDTVEPTLELPPTSTLSNVSASSQASPFKKSPTAFLGSTGVKNPQVSAKQTEQVIAGLVDTKTRGYSANGNTLEQGYLPIVGETVVRNFLQPEVTTKMARVHANQILMEALDINDGYKQVKLSDRGWAMIYKPNFDFKQIEQAPNFAIAQEIGFRFNEATKVASWRKEDADVTALVKRDAKEVQSFYNKIYEAASHSHVLNSHNNLFVAGSHQSSSFLLELNKVIGEYNENKITE